MDSHSSLKIRSALLQKSVNCPTIFFIAGLFEKSRENDCFRAFVNTSENLMDIFESLVKTSFRQVPKRTDELIMLRHRRGRLRWYRKLRSLSGWASPGPVLRRSWRRCSGCHWSGSWRKPPGTSTCGTSSSHVVDAYTAATTGHSCWKIHPWCSPRKRENKYLENGK